MSLVGDRIYLQAGIDAHNKTPRTGERRRAHKKQQRSAATTTTALNILRRASRNRL